VNAAGKHGHAVDDHMGDARRIAPRLIERARSAIEAGSKIVMSAAKPGRSAPPSMSPTRRRGGTKG
jgi:hypothetical protein